MAIEIGGGITIGAGIVFSGTPTPPAVSSTITTESNDPLLTENGLYLVTES